MLALFAAVSLEALPRETAGNDVVWARVPADTRVFITRLPRADIEDSVAAAKRLRQRGLRPVPHLTARSLESVSALERILNRLRIEAGVEDVLLLAGADAQPAGPFENSLQVIATGALERARLRRVGVAGHPEGRPQAD